jgi:orotidine-5'-phosphate decarboxylase
MLCVGLDPLIEQLPAGLPPTPRGCLEFCKQIVDSVADLVCAFKPQAAHFAAIGGENELAALIGYVHARHRAVPVILDAKRGDIGSTAVLYAREAFDRYDADAVTVSPFLGPEGLRPFLAYRDRGVLVLCRTSNPDSNWLQGENAPGAEPVFVRIARAANGWNDAGNVMLVAGATYPEDLARIRAVAPEIPLLVPGIGAQGGEIDAVVDAGCMRAGFGLAMSASRSVLYASRDVDFATAARAVATDLHDAIAAAHERSRTRSRIGRRSAT